MANAIDLRGLVRPQLVESTKREDTPNVAEFRLQPLERGFGYTLGNAMRRMLLSSLRGSAVWGFRIDGVVHEHQTIPGVVEDVHQIIANLNDSFSVGPVFVYQLTDYAAMDKSKVHWVSTGVRPIWHFNKYVSLAGEAGWDWVKDEKAGTDGNLFKVTLAPQVSLGGRFMSRPVIRAFVTYATWSDDFVGQVGGLDYRTANQGFTYGLQMEGWW